MFFRVHFIENSCNVSGCESQQIQKETASAGGNERIVNMKGMYRKIDRLGRIVLPIEIRRSFGLEHGSEVNIQVVSGGILLSPVNESCVFCGRADDLLAFKSTPVCERCVSELQRD